MSRVGETIAHRFALETVAGSGGMGTVYRARDATTGEPVAVKFVHGGDRARFEREVAALAGIGDAAIVRYIHHGVADDGQSYLVMEWLEGEDLEKRLRHGPLAVADALGLAKSLARALATLHAAGIVHRDIKPANLLLEHGDLARLKVLDLGIARIASSSQTATGTVLGTPAYMAPEQARGDRALDARADVFAAGCVLYECLAGSAAFVGDGPIAVLAKVLLEEPPMLREMRADVPPALESLVAQLLSKDPALRPVDGRALLDAIERAERSHDEPASQRAPAGISNAELRIVSVVLAAPSFALDDTIAADVAADSDRTAVTTATESGARIVRLAGGSFLAAYVGSSSPKDLAHRAASCALAWRTLLAGRTVVVATGRAAMLAQRAPVGAAIDAAAALARESPSDGVILDETTASLLADAFQVQRERDRHVLIGRLNSEPMRELLGRPIPCVGRERELAMLVSLLDESIGESVARAVLVVAPAGTGKTRLVDEFVRGARERLGDRPIAKIRLDAHDATSPFGLAARCVRQIAQLDSRLAPVERWHALAQRIGARLPGAAGQRAASFLAEIIVADGAMPADPQVLAARRDPVAMAAGVRAAFLDWMAAEVGTEPNVLVIEDLHWADAPSVRLVEALLERLSDSPLTVIATARPEVDAAFPTLFAGRDLQALRLGALARRAAARLVRAALPEANDALVESIVQRAAGHPFYVEELIRAIASGASPDVLPDSVLGMLQGRLDALDENARRVLRAASVFGQVFHDEAVGSLLADRGAAIAGLDVLVDREVIERMAGAENSRFGTYMFRHALVRDAAYATLPDGERVRAHALAAAWLEREAEADPAVLADHYERGDVAERAAHWFTVAAGKALDANDLAGCIAAADRARFHTPVNETGFLDLLVGEATYWRGDPAGSATFAQRALERLEPGSESWFRAATLLVAGAGQGGDNDTVDRVVTRAGATPPAKGAEGELAGLLARGVTQLVWLGPTVSGPHRARLAEVAPDARAFDPRLAALIHRAQGDYATVIEFDLLRGAASLDQAVEAFERAGGARDAQMVSLLALAWRGMAGDGEAAVRLEQRIAELERVSMPYARNFARMLLGQLLLSREEAERAIAILRDAVPALRGSVRLVFHARQGLALAYFERGRYEDALRENAAVLEMPARGKLLATATAVQALACLAVGRRDEAVAAARAGLEQAKPSDRWEVLEGLVELAAASVFVATGARDEAARVVEEGMTRLSRMASHMPDGGSAFWAIPIPNRRLRELAREIGLEGR